MVTTHAEDLGSIPISWFFLKTSDGIFEEICVEMIGGISNHYSSVHIGEASVEESLDEILGQLLGKFQSNLCGNYWR